MSDNFTMNASKPCLHRNNRKGDWRWTCTRFARFQEPFCMVQNSYTKLCRGCSRFGLIWAKIRTCVRLTLSEKWRQISQEQWKTPQYIKFVFYISLRYPSCFNAIYSGSLHFRRSFPELPMRILRSTKFFLSSSLRSWGRIRIKLSGFLPLSSSQRNLIEKREERSSSTSSVYVVHIPYHD